MKGVPAISGSDSFVLENDREPIMDGKGVPLTTIDRMVAELRLRRLDFVKMDIEGAEEPALTGAQTTLARFRPRMSITVYHRPQDRERLPSVIRQSVPDYVVDYRCLHAGGPPRIAFFSR